MPFTEIDVAKEVEKRCAEDTKFKNAFTAVQKEHDIRSFVVKYREQHGTTQKEIGDLLELTEQSISEIENMNTSLDLRTFLKYINAVGLDIKIINGDKE